MSAGQERSGEPHLQQESFQPQAPALSLPKGGGAIRGIGEKFSANPVTGSASVSVPIATSPGRAGFRPSLTLTYDSGAGNGPFGLGWTLSLPAIARKTDRGLPTYRDWDESDVFVLFGAEDLVPELGSDGKRFEDSDSVPDYRIHRYRPRVEGAFSRIERWTRIDSAADVHWRITSRDNVLSIYGKDERARIADPENPSRIFSWLISETRDDRGNAVVYDYKPEDGAAVDLAQAHEHGRGDRSAPRRSANRNIKRIRYGNRTTLLATDGDRPSFLTREQIDSVDWMFDVVFDYGEGHVEILPADASGHESVTATINGLGEWPVRADPFSSYRAGFEVRTYRLCRRVLMFHHFPDALGVADCLVRSTEFAYEETPAASFMTAVTQCGYVRRGDGYLKRSLPPVQYDYSRAVLGDEVREIDPASLDNLPQGTDGANYQWVDLDGEGLSGILTEQAGAWLYKRNESAATQDPETGAYSARFAPLETVARTPAGNPLTAGGAQLLDLAGDGQLDVVALDRPVAGFYERTPDEDWEPFRAFASVPTVAWNDPNLRFVDLTGDGHADVLITEDHAFTWYPSLGEEGFGPAERVAVPTDEERGPRLVFADGTQTIFLADCSGDGLTDLVRIRNREICYWPNLGYGRFGPKVVMDRSPHFDHADQFDPRRIRLADIDGTGPTDIIYLGAREIRCWLNQSGNAWSDAHPLAGFPAMSSVASVAAVDLLGNGTACLVWSSPLPGDTGRAMRYVELMAEGKPHLLVGIRNNLGAETRIDYRPSTYFYLRDKLAGRPWITRLPFPVHCVETVTVSDRWRGTRFATRYSYHHGHFDGVEREFRGFGRVEQIDVESFGQLDAADPQSPYITGDRTLYQPPVKTVTWFHTGVFVDRERVLRQFEHEYFRTPAFDEHRLPEPDLGAQSLDADEWREALRACKGMTLRQEVYELDLDAWLDRGEQRPVKLFTVATHNCWIERLQQRGANRHAVFLAGESEAITYHHELDLVSGALPDPRIAHTLHLRFDDLGNPLQSVAVVYPRIGEHADDILSPADRLLIREVQAETHLAYTETRYTDDVVPAGDQRDYRLRVPCEVLTYELTGVVPAGFYFTLAELRGLRLSPVHQSEGTAVTALPYHRLSGDGGPAKRLVEHLRTLYFSQDLSGPLPLGQLDARGLPFESYKLALTDELLAAVFGDRLTDGIRAELDDAAQSGYLGGSDLAARFPGEPFDPSESTDGQYWVRSGIAGFMFDAAAHFFLPERYTDAFGQTTTLEYDPLDLFVRRSTDPVGNTVSIETFDYRVLAPTELRDINGNRSRVAFDVLGLPVATAVMGKGTEADNLDGFDAERTD
uniref:SpvB/TcaC N-terminal domain-containing protein n=1 Tax=Thiocapsa sp. TaxID=2024551 RepID=UPI003593C861